jgi:outer membrane biogenesis lipoprotein LolB
MRWVLIGAFIISLFSACATAPKSERLPGAPEGFDAPSVLDALKRKNSTLNSFKGLGSLRLRDHDSIQAYRVAWAGAGEDRLRIEVMGPAGKPVARLAMDGRHLYFHSFYPQRFHRKPLSDNSLKYLTDVPIKISDLQAFMRGRIPIRPYRRSVFSKKDEPGKSLLVLKNWWGVTVERIHLDPVRNRFSRLEFFSGGGQPVYHALLDDYQSKGVLEMPYRMTFTSMDKSHGLELAVERLWMNVPVSENMFTLKNPEMEKAQSPEN